MNAHALSKISDTDLYKLLDTHYAKRSLNTGSKDTAHESKLIREVTRRVGSVIETATKTLPDAEAAFNEARYTLTSPEAVTFFLNRWRTGSLASLAWGVARRNEVREAGLAGRKQSETTRSTGRAVNPSKRWLKTDTT